MIRNVYAVRDVHTGFGAPIIDENDESAIRGFAYAMTNSNPVIGFAPKDFDLYRLGTFDCSSGSIVGYVIPEFVISGREARTIGENYAK